MTILKIPGSPDINYARTGPAGGTPLLFVHALGLDLSVWEPQFAALGAERDLIAIDLPGHGLSAPLETPPSFDTMAQMLAQCIAHLGLTQVDLIGISVGGMIAQTVAVRFPTLVRSLTLVATLCTFSDAVREVIRHRASFVRQHDMAVIIPLHLERWFPADFRRRRPDVLDRFTKILNGQHPEFHACMWEMVATLDVEQALTTVQCPVLVVAGADDPSAPPPAGQVIVDRVNDGRLVVLPDCGHFPQIEQAAQFNSMLRRFTADICAS